MWAVRANGPLSLSDSGIAASVEHMLTSHGPLNLEQLACLTDLSGVHLSVFERFFSERTDFYECAEDGTWWFAGHKRPVPVVYDSMRQALMHAFAEFPNGAKVEDLHWFLCLSTVGRIKAITRRRVSRELSRRTDLFTHVSRATYAPLRTRDARGPALRVAAPAFPRAEWQVPVLARPPDGQPRALHEEEEFNPFAFFTGEFQFASGEPVPMEK
jgi:hypothetical protein